MEKPFKKFVKDECSALWHRDLGTNSQMLDETVASLVSSPQHVDLFYKRSALRCETRCALGATFRGSEVLKAIRGMHGTIPEQALL